MYFWKTQNAFLPIINKFLLLVMFKIAYQRIKKGLLIYTLFRVEGEGRNKLLLNVFTLFTIQINFTILTDLLLKLLAKIINSKNHLCELRCCVWGSHLTGNSSKLASLLPSDFDRYRFYICRYIPKFSTNMAIYGDRTEFPRW